MTVDKAGALGRTWPLAFVLLSIGGIQFGATLAKPLFAIVGAQGASSLRLGIAALILAVVVRPWRVALSARTLWLILAYGLALAAGNLCFFMAIRTVPLGVTVAIEFAGPLGVAIAMSRRWLDFVWAGLAATGIALLMPFTGFGAALDPGGIGFAVVAAGCWASYIVIGQKAGRGVPSPVATALGLAVAALAVVPFGIAHAGANLLRADVLPLGVAVAIVSGSLPYTLEMAALKHLPTRVFGILMSLEPAAGALFGYVVLGQHLSGVQGAAIAAVMAASVGVTLTNRPPPAATTIDSP